VQKALKESLRNKFKKTRVFFTAIDEVRVHKTQFGKPHGGRKPPLDASDISSSPVNKMSRLSVSAAA